LATGSKFPAEKAMSATSATNRVEGGGAQQSPEQRLLSLREGRERNRTSTTLSVIVPAYNEQYLIEASLKGLAVLDESPRLREIKVIVVNDCSTDRTAEAIQRFQSNLQSSQDFKKFSWIWLDHHKNQGKGAAIRTGLEHVDTELVVIHDADLEYHPRDLIQMVELFLSENADAVFGSRFMPGGYKRALFFRHQLGNKLLTFLCDLVCDLNLTDMETCYKMVRAEFLKSIPLTGSRFDVEPELAIKIAKRGGRIFEVPISYSGRTYAEGKKINWKDGVHALWAILRYATSDQIYARDGHGGEILMRLARAPRFTRWMADVIRPFVGDRVLEIGAGTGNMTAHLVPRSIYWATDVNPFYLETLDRLRPSRPYLQTAYVDAMEGSSFPQEGSFDTIICLNVVEHLSDDVGALRNIHKALQDGGRAIVLVPNGPRLFGTLDEVLGHCRRYTEDQLTKVGQEAGFTVEKVLKFNRPGVPAWWLNGRVLRKTTFGLGQIRLLNLLTPLFRVMDSWLPLPPLSLIAIFRKSGGQGLNELLSGPPASGGAGSSDRAAI
jgi:glycosyltransferase involved in cell wall biosynthesis/protein-L-isoaspartate O-methyltransferase